MNLPENLDLSNMLEDVGSDELANLLDDQESTPKKPRRDISQMLRKIPVTVTLEVGSARVSLHDLLAIESGSVLELDKLAGEPLVIKVNGTPVGLAEVVVAGENYGLKVVEMEYLDLDSLTS